MPSTKQVRPRDAQNVCKKLQNFPLKFVVKNLSIQKIVTPPDATVEHEPKDGPALLSISPPPPFKKMYGPSGEQNHGYATVRNGLTCRSLRGIEKHPSNFRYLYIQPLGYASRPRIISERALGGGFGVSHGPHVGGFLGQYGFK